MRARGSADSYLVRLALFENGRNRWIEPELIAILVQNVITIERGAQRRRYVGVAPEWPQGIVEIKNNELGERQTVG